MMEKFLFDKLKEEEVKAFIDYITECGEKSRVTATPEYLLRHWNENKQELFYILQENLILKKHIVFSKSVEDVEYDFDEMKRNEGSLFYHNITRFSREFARGGWPSMERNPLESLYEDRDEMYNVCWNLESLFSNDYLYSNIYGGNTFTIRYYDNKTLRIEHGCKVSKALGKIAKVFNLDGYEEFRIAVSQIKNQRKLEGNLCLSIHPLDFQTMSDNDCGWDSCMSWVNEGEYRAGTVEMMNSPMVVVAYLESESSKYKMTYGTNFMWNSKKWRCLYIVNRDVIAENRQYPYDNADIASAALDWLKELCSAHAGWGPYTTAPVLMNMEGAFKVPELSAEETYRVKFHTNLMYNDMYDRRRGYMSENIPHNYNINFSGQSECMFCGESWDYRDEDNECGCLALSCCNPHFYCSCCEERIDGDEKYYLEDEVVCRWCYEDHAESCQACEETVGDWHTYSIHLYHNDKYTHYNTRICDGCFNSLWDAYGDIKTTEIYGSIYRVDAEKLPEKYLEWFEVFADCEDTAEDYATFVQAYSDNAKEKDQE